MRVTGWTWIGAAAGVGIPAFALTLTGTHVDPRVAAVVYGLGIVGGAFLLSWAAEVAQLDISASLAIAVLALIAVLPEYSIEAVLAWKAGASFDVGGGTVTPEMGRVAANVTGANRLLIGVGWSMVVLIYWLKRRRPLDLRGHARREMVALAVATLLSLLVFFTEQVHLALAATLIAVYVVYLWASSVQETEEPELVGALPPLKRRLAVAALLVYAAAVILIAAEPFIESLVDTGLEMGIDEFILIQWIAPLASESPEIIIAMLFSLRENPVAGITTLISSEVNQLTLLVGSMPLVFSLSAGEPLSFLLEGRQATEFLLTSAVSVFALVLIAPRLIGWRAGLLLLSLFVVHLFFVDESERRLFAYLYFALALAVAAVNRRSLLGLVTGGDR